MLRVLLIFRGDTLAYHDYGYILKKNNEIIKTKDLCMNMKETVGISIEGVSDNYFAYMGDKEMFVAIYKDIAVIFVNGKEVKRIKMMDSDHRLSYKRYRLLFDVNGIRFELKRLGDSQYRIRFTYKGDRYSCVYGYGVGEHVYSWWRNVLGLSKKEYEWPLKWYKYV